MNKQELKDLWQAYLKTKELSDQKKLVEHYYNTFVKCIAAKVAKKIKYMISPEELASYGTIGLYKSLESFDSTKNVKFETYSFSRIWGSMIDEIRKNDWVPRSVRLRQTLLEKTREKLEARYCRKISETEILKKASISEVEYNKSLKKYNATSTLSLEGYVSQKNDEDKEFNKYLQDKNLKPVEDHLVREEFIKKILGKDFSRVERKIVFLYYYEKLTMNEIADTIKMSESRVSQMHQNILEKMGKKIKVNPEHFGVPKEYAESIIGK